MAAPSYFVKSLLRIGALQGRPVLEALVTGQFTTLQQGGMRMVSTAVAGQAFTFAVDSKLGVQEIMSTAEEALETWDGLGGAEAVAALLARPPLTRAPARFF